MMCTESTQGLLIMIEHHPTFLECKTILKEFHIFYSITLTKQIKMRWNLMKRINQLVPGYMLHEICRSKHCY